MTHDGIEIEPRLEVDLERIVVIERVEAVIDADIRSSSPSNSTPPSIPKYCDPSRAVAGDAIAAAATAASNKYLRIF